MSKTFDLSTLGLSAGTHEITVKARASGYLDSAPSNAVSYVVAEETTYKLSGTWKFNSSIHTGFFENKKSHNEEITFSSYWDSYPYNREYVEIIIQYEYMTDFDNDIYNRVIFVTSGGSQTTVVQGENDTDNSKYISNWSNEAYRTITFDGEQTVSQEFYEWFIANAVKQAEKITDLTGTTWVFNDTVTAAAGYGTFNAFFWLGNTAPVTSDNKEHYSSLWYIGQTIDFETFTPVNSADTVCDSGGVTIVDSGTPVWKYVTIEDSTDVTNTALIDWLYANAKQLITFTIDGKTCQAESGMTWGEWCGSEYNTANAYDNGNIYGSSGKPLFEGEGYTWADMNSEYAVRTNELIIANHAYYSMTGGFGDQSMQTTKIIKSTIVYPHLGIVEEIEEEVFEYEEKEKGNDKSINN